MEDLRAALAERYALERELGRGGMGTVYLAEDLRHGRRVAIKVLRPEIAASLGIDRFLREIRIAARLTHPHILPLHDSGEAAGLLYYVMPYVEGETLRERLLREGRLPLADALRIGCEVADALDHAHRHGFVHRDIKPGNILLSGAHAYLCDFGIAHALHIAGEAELTQSGMTFGTPTYMSPEQRSGSGRIDGRSDIYSLGCMLYEMLAGARFTTPPTQPDLLPRTAEPPAPLRQLRPEVPASVDAAVSRALQAEPGDRFQTAAELRDALMGGPVRSLLPLAVTTAGPGPPAPVMPRSPGRRSIGIPLAGAITLMLGLLIGGAWLAWRRVVEGGAPREAGARIVAVLPFESLSDSADAYFADGVADEVRAKLAQVEGLEVIARGSSIEYRGTSKRPTEIARELGANYLLTGTVRWERAAGGHRVRVTPELVDAGRGQAARTRWVRQFDASLTDVFQVQADIATKVADALGVALADSTRRELRAQPTENLSAYDEYLKGEAASGTMKGDQASLRRAIGFYERAVALDSTFVQAWSQLSRARTSLYSNGVPSPELGEAARFAAERARRLRPKDPWTHLAMGDYYGNVNPIDNERAAAEYEEGLRIAPDNVDLLGAAALTDASLGRWGGVVRRLQRAVVLDPRSLYTARRLSAVHTFMRNYAAGDSAADRAVALAPTNPGILFLKVLVTLARGDLDSAQSVIRAAARRIDPEVLYPFFASYQDLYWVLDDDQQRQVLAAPPSAFDDDRGSWAIVRAELYYLRGDRRRTAVYADSARLALEEQTRAAPDDGQRHVFLGLALAYLGRKADAVREGRRGMELMPISRDAYYGAYIQLQLARIYLLLGEPEQALDQLEPLLRLPFYLSPGWLKIDPTFDPVRRNPRFERLVKGP